jgi:hypothetical protein
MPKSKPRSKQPVKQWSTPSEFVALVFGFHQVCANTHCRRAKACKGGGACFDVFWPHVPLREKERYRKTITARCSGASIEDAMAAGEAAAQAVDADEIRDRVPTSCPVAPEPAKERIEPPASREPGPRIWFG